MAHYFSPEELLSSQKLVTVITKEDMNYLFYLDPASRSGDGHVLRKGREIKIPIWMARLLAKEKKVEISTPMYMSKEVLQRLDTDPEIQQLDERCKDYYSVVSHIAHGLPDKRDLILKTLLKTFQKRFETIAQHSDQLQWLKEKESHKGKYSSEEKKVIRAFKRQIKRRKMKQDEKYAK
ncbi:GINS complex, subunit Psf3 like protein [Aduncisulcus paluster]|uniref:GINS complex, subunit Psf3 like protein n=1 Tax=Aduncisulcus paluster TaxID=2918883 RepID=A0ABQ5K4E1_9EUKA|nr:GINS complex, subunit Psf3 like protein [Aduncisulcus paluster]